MQLIPIVDITRKTYISVEVVYEDEVLYSIIIDGEHFNAEDE